MKLFPFQAEAVTRVRDAFRGGADSVCLVLPTGSGKCHPAGTTVLKADGTAVAVKEIRPGMRLQGPDSRPRRVVRVGRGHGMIYEVRPVKGAPWRCNVDHQLLLVRTGERNLLKYPSDFRAGEIVQVSVREWLKWSDYRKHVFKLYRAPLQRFRDADDPYPIAGAYVLGLLLGDGCLVNSGVSITTSSSEIVAALQAFVDSREGSSLRLTVGRYRNRTPTYRLVARKPGEHYIRDYLRKTGLDGCTAAAKFVPQGYKGASRLTRSYLLAGLLDSDGSLTRGGFDYVSKSPRLARDVSFLAQSLGLAAYIAPKNIVYAGETRLYWRVHISGDTTIIPTRLPNKQAAPRRQKKNVLRTGIREIVPVAANDYYGFELDRDGQYLLEDFTVCHNTACAGEIIARILAAQPNPQFLFLCHRQEILKQALKELAKFGLGNECGVIAPGHPERPWKPIQIGMIQTVMNRLDLLAWLKPLLIVIDECHHVRAPTWERVVTWFAGAKVLGLTATPERLDGRGLGAIFQLLVIGPAYLFLVGIGRLAPIRFLGPRMPLSRKGLTVRNGEFVKAEVEERFTRQVIVAAANAWLKYAASRKTMHFAVSRAHSRHHVEQLAGLGISAEHVDGDMSEDQRDGIFARLESGQTQVLSNVNIATEGVDVPSVECVHISFFTESITRWHQAIGRGSRPKASGLDNLVLDGAGNLPHLGSPEADIEWTLDGGATGASISAAASAWRFCKRCRQATAARLAKCRHCGHIHGLELPQEADMDLVEATGPLPPPKRRGRSRPKHRQSEIGPRIYATGGDERQLYLLASELGYSPYVVGQWQDLYADKWRRKPH